MQRPRQLAIETLEDRAPYLQAWAFEIVPASPEDVVDSYISKIADARLVIWLVGSTITDAVEAEIEEALRTNTDVLAFLLPVADRDQRAKAFLARVRTHFRYRLIADVDLLPLELDRALTDVVIRALRESEQPSTAEYLDLVGRASRARCIERWLAAGIDAETAIKLAGRVDVGAAPADLLPSDVDPLVVLTGESGVGKSLAAERFLQDAVVARLSSAQAPTPVFVRARDVDGGLRQAVESAVEQADSPARTGVALVIDGADEAGAAAADRLLAEARELSRAWPGSQIVLTTRPLTPFANAQEARWLPRLSEAGWRGVVGIGAGRKVTAADMHSWSQPAREAAEIPLFALLLGRRLKASQPGGSRAELLSDLARTAADSVDSESRPLLRRLAILSVMRGNGPVPESELGGPEQASQLERTRLVSRIDGSLRFPLVLIAQWFAAEELAEGRPAVSELVAAPEDLELWRYPLALLTANFDHGRVSAVIGPLVQAHPGFASQVIEEAIAKWTSDRSQALPPLQESGRRIREASTAWLEGLGQLGQGLFPSAVSEGGEIKLPPLGVVIHESEITAGWYSGDAPEPEVIRLPDEVLNLMTAVAPELRETWPRIRSSHPSTQAAWAWRWSFEELRSKLEWLLKERQLTTSPETKRRRLWRAALILGELPNDHATPIPIGIVRDRAREIDHDEGPTTYSTPRGQVEIDALFEALEAVAATGQDQLEPPMKPRSRGQILLPSQVRNELVLAELAELYQRALDEYSALTTGLFAPLRPFMSMASILPACLHGELYPVDPGVSAMNAGMGWWLEPLPAGQPSRTQISMTEEPAPNTFRESWVAQAELFQQRISRLRPQQARWLVLSLHSQLLRGPSDSELDEIVLEWLWADLRQIGWVDGQLGEPSRWRTLP